MNRDVLWHRKSLIYETMTAGKIFVITLRHLLRANGVSVDTRSLADKGSKVGGAWGYHDSRFRAYPGLRFPS